jgi:hypothetical protein
MDKVQKHNSLNNENGDLLANSHISLKRRKNYFCQLLNIYIYMYGVNDVSQRERHTAKPLLHDSRIYNVEIILKICKKL